VKTQKFISVMSGVIVFFLAGSAFVLSYDSLYRLAIANGITPWLAWLWPLCLDAFVVSASLAVLRNSLISERTFYQWVLVGSFTILSISFNAIHAPSNWLARSIFALPPLVVFLAFELLVSQIKSSARRRSASQSLQAITEAVVRAKSELADLEHKADELQKPQATVAKLEKTGTKIEQLASRIEALLASLENGATLQPGQIAKRLEASAPNVSKALKHLESQGVIHRNGQIELVRER